MQQLDVETIEKTMKRYILLLPLVIEGQSNQEYAVVYRDWDAGDVNHKNYYWVCVVTILRQK